MLYILMKSSISSDPAAPGLAGYAQFFIGADSAALSGHQICNNIRHRHQGSFSADIDPAILPHLTVEIAASSGRLVGKNLFLAQPA